MGKEMSVRTHITRHLSPGWTLPILVACHATAVPPHKDEGAAPGQSCIPRDIPQSLVGRGSRDTSKEALTPQTYPKARSSRPHRDPCCQGGREGFQASTRCTVPVHRDSRRGRRSPWRSTHCGSRSGRTRTCRTQSRAGRRPSARLCTALAALVRPARSSRRTRVR